MKKRLFSMLLAAALLLGLFPAGAAVPVSAAQASEAVTAAAPKNGAYLTVGGFEAALLTYGDTADGNVQYYVNGEAMSEQEIMASGAVYFTTSDAAVAEVDPTDGTVTCVGEGIATVTAYVLMDGVVTSDTATVSVSDSTDLASITLSASVDYVGVGNSLQLQISGKKASGANADLSKIAVAYTCSSTAATVSGSGKVTGVTPGSVTVTAQIGVNGRNVSNAIELDVVSNAELSGDDVIIDFTHGRVVDAADATLEADGYTIVKDETYQSGSTLVYTTKVGLQMPATPVGEKLTMDVQIARDGWYRLEVTGGLFSYGNINDVFLDGDFMGVIDFSAGDGQPYLGYSQMNTVYLTAGAHRVEFVSTKKGDILLGRLNFYRTEEPEAVTLQAENKTLLVGQTVDAGLTATDSNGMDVSLKAVSSAPSYDNYYILTSSKTSVVTVSGSTLTAKATGTATVTAKGKWQGQSVEKKFSVTVTSGKIAQATLTGTQTLCS